MRSARTTAAAKYPTRTSPATDADNSFPSSPIEGPSWNRRSGRSQGHPASDRWERGDDGVLDGGHPDEHQVLLSAKTRAQDSEAVDLVKDCLAAADASALRNAVVSISLRRPGLSSRLHEVLCPTLIITGTDHEGWTPAQAHAASRLLPDGSSAVIADAAYLAPLEAPGDTVLLIRQFWKANHEANRRPT